MPAVLLVGLALQAAAAAGPETLQVGQAAQLQPGQAVHYEQSLAAGEFLRVVVEQQGADVDVRILDPAGAQVFYGDSRPLGSESESAFWVAETAGPHALVVTNKGREAGGVRVAEVERWPASTEDRALARAELHLRVAELKRRDQSAAALAECVGAAEAARALLPPRHERRLAALAFLGICNRDLNHHEAARAAFEEALAMARALGVAVSEAENLVYLGNLHTFRGEFRESLAMQEQAAAIYARIGKKSGEGFARNNAANLRAQLGQTEQAMEGFQAAAAAFKEAHDARGEALARSNLGVLLQRLGRADAALAVLEEAVRGLHETKSRTAEASALNTMASVFGDLGDHPRARAYAEQSLAIRRQLGDRRAQARSHSALGQSYLEEGALRDARTHLETAVALARETKDQDEEAWALFLLGRVQRRQGAADALATWEQALRLRRETGAVLEEGWLLTAMAEAHLESGRLPAARELLDRGLAQFREVADPHGEAQALYLLARVARAEGRRAEALERAQAALAVAESVRARVASAELRATYLAKVRRYYELVIELLLEPRADEAAVERAFAVSERARARALLDLFAFTAAELDAALDPELRRQRAELQGEIAALQSDLMRAASSPGERSARRDLATRLEGRYEAYDLLEQEIRRGNPRYASLAYPPTAGAAAARALLREGDVLLEFFAGEAASYVFVVRGGGLEAHRLPGVRVLQPSIDDVRAGLEKPSRLALQRFVRGARALYRALLQPAAARLRGPGTLLIAPDGPLYRVPFEALLTRSPAAADSAALPYLLRQHAVRYVPSVAVMQQLRAAPAPAALDLFAVGDPGPAGQKGDADPAARRSLFGDQPLSSLPSLPGARREVESIARLFAADRVRVLLGSSATEDGVKGADLRAARYLHFATHALVSERRPAESGLVLARGPVDEDAFLQVHEIVRLELDADLVTLSACSTGLGREVLGEGLLGLTQAFLAAGARGVLATLWPVTDVSSSELMVSFYSGLSRGAGTADALRAAKLELLRGARWSHPHHWASYVMIGR